MSAIHELREDYRHFRVEHPRLRGLFLLGDLVGLLIKLALFAGFLFLCWYIVSRGPTDGPAATATVPEPVAQQSLETAQDPSQELTDERVALLRQIANQTGTESERSEGLLGSVSSDSGSRGLIGSAAPATGGNQADRQADQSQELTLRAFGPVQVESFADNNALAGYEVSDDIPTAALDNRETGQPSAGIEVSGGFSDEIFEPAGDVENGLWVLGQDNGDFTMQLALTVNVEFLVDYAGKLPVEHVASIFPERRNRQGDIQYSLSLGSFPTKRSAEAALADLSPDLRRYGAHVRDFDEVQANVSTFLQ